MKIKKSQPKLLFLGTELTFSDFDLPSTNVYENPSTIKHFFMGNYLDFYYTGIPFPVRWDLGERAQPMAPLVPLADTTVDDLTERAFPLNAQFKAGSHPYRFPAD